MSCLFNSFDPYFKQPFGAVRAGQTVRLSLCIPEELGYVDPHLVLKKEGKFDVPVYYRMNFDGQTPRQNHFSVEVPLNDPGLYFYYFDLYTDFRRIVRGPDNCGVVSWQEGESWQITVYEADFETPAPIKGKVFYQIFPDRFCEGVENKPMPFPDRLYQADKHAEPFWQPNEVGGHLNEDYFGRDDVIPMWVADMDFACAPCVVEAVQKRAAHPVYGYGMRQQPYYDAVMGWLKKRHGFEVNYEHLAFAPPGVIYALNVMLRILTKPGDRVMVPMPNYDPLFDMVTRGGRKLVETPLVWKDGRYTFDFADMEAKAASGVKVLVLSSPHNPTGRVWTRQELEGVAEICLRHNIFMLVDEIHCDFVPPEHPHTTFGLLGEEVLRHSMVCYSSNKGFNLGGLGMATLVLADDDLRCKFNEEMSIAQTRLDNIFGMAALIAAYNDGEEWLDQAIAYVSDNKAYLDQFLRERIPQIRMIPSEGTYLVWLDCSQLPYRGMALEHFMINEAKVAFCAGYEFGKQGEAFLRMNVACPRCTLTKALEQMEKAINGLSLQ